MFNIIFILYIFYIIFIHQINFKIYSYNMKYTLLLIIISVALNGQNMKKYIYRYIIYIL